MSDGPTKKLIEQAVAEAALKRVEELLPLEERKAVLIAKVRKMHYNASVAQGFAPAQALRLCLYPEMLGPER